MNSSPKLKEAMAEIRAVLLKHDIAAHVVLHEPGFSEFLMHLEPTWSVVRVENEQIRVRSKLQEDFSGDKQAKRTADEGSLNMLCHFADLLERDAAIFRQLSEWLTQRWQAEHTEGVLTKHRAQ